MPVRLSYRGWDFWFDDMPKSADIEERFRERVLDTEIKVPVGRPTPLARNTSEYSQKELEGAVTAVFSSEGSTIKKPLLASLQEAGAEVTCFESVAEVDSDSQPWNALVFDATAIRKWSELDSLRAFFQVKCGELQKSGKIVLIARPETDASTAEVAGICTALHGFAKSLAGEVGPGGATVNILWVESGAESSLRGVLSYFLSPRSAFTTGQSLKVASVPLAPQSQGASGLEGKTALITGAGRGMGAITSDLLAAEGVTIVAVDLRDTPELHRFEAAGGLGLALDICSETAPDEIAAAARQVGGFDIVIHNAGTLGDSLLINMTAETWRSPMAVNFGAPAAITQCLVENELINSFGRVLFVSSVSGIGGAPTLTAYAASKSAIFGVVRHFATELSEKQITVNAVAPGFTLTPFNERMPDWMKRMMYRMNDLSQPGHPEDIANALTFLATPGAQGISGQILRVCGGAMGGA